MIRSLQLIKTVKKSNVSKKKQATITRARSGSMSRIALVDDDRNILTSVSMTLEAEGFDVETFNDGQSALDAFNKKLPDMAVLDIKMPRMDGMDLLQRLRQKTTMLSASANRAMRSVCGVGLMIVEYLLSSKIQVQVSQKKRLPRFSNDFIRNVPRDSLAIIPA